MPYEVAMHKQRVNIVANTSFYFKYLNEGLMMS